MNDELVSILREQYPDPLESESDYIEESSVCVGGALCCYLNKDNILPFPDEEELSSFLREVNNRLPSRVAMSYANDIILNNDASMFSTSWRILDEAVRYGSI